MHITRLALGTWVSIAAFTMSTAPAAWGQNYPVKPIRILTSEAGGGNDFIARTLAQGLSPNIGQQVIVDNRSGNYVVGAVAAKAQADGYTLVVFSNVFWYGPLLESNAPYDPLRDFLTVSITGTSPSVLVVTPSLPAKSTKELIALAKAKPGELNYASGTTGTQAHLYAELFKSMAGIDVVRVPFKGSGPALSALIAAQVQMMIVTAASGSPHVQSGRLRGLAVTSLQPSVLFPDMPTIAATLPGYETLSVAGVFVPAKTPRPVINRLNQELVRYMSSSDAKEKFLRSGNEPVSSTPEEFTAVIKADMGKIGKVIKDAGLRVQ
jgi:tripartite-type tricarboxylate transporter receptor subunit TctC